jgi:hypothetical protein
MPNDLRSTIDAFAKTFAASIVASLRGASLDDVLAMGVEHAAPAKRGPGRPKKSASPAPTASTQTATTLAAAPSVAAVKRGPGRPKKIAAAPVSKPAAKKSPKGGRLARRSQAQIEKTLGDVVVLLKKRPGLRAEQIRAELKLDVKEMPRVLAEGLTSKKLTKKGEKRATAYSAK